MKYFASILVIAVLALLVVIAKQQGDLQAIKDASLTDRALLVTSFDNSKKLIEVTTKLKEKEEQILKLTKEVATYKEQAQLLEKENKLLVVQEFNARKSLEVATKKLQVAIIPEATWKEWATNAWQNFRKK